MKKLFPILILLFSVVASSLADDPPIIATRDIEVSLNLSGEVHIQAADLIEDLNDDITPVEDLLLDLSEEIFNCADLGPQTVTLTVEDADGNSVSRDAVVTVIDDLPPQATVQTIDIFLDNTGSASITPDDVITSLSDNCSDPENIQKSLNKTNFGCADIGNYGLILTIEDEAGNSDQVNLSVRVFDNEAPELIFSPGNITVSNDPGDCGAIVNFTQPAFRDNCAGTGLNGTLEEGLAPGSFFPVGTTTVKYTFNDGNSNEISEVFTVTVTDEEKPQISTEASDGSLECSQGDAYLTAFNNWLSIQGGAVATDNCGSVDWSNNYDEDNWEVICGNSRYIDVVFTATDDFSNFESTTARFTITDTEKPYWLTAEGSLDRTFSCENTTGINEALTLEPAIGDNCSGDDLSLDYTPVPFEESENCSQAGKYVRKWKYTDACGNESDEFIQTISITDTKAPEWVDAEGSLDRTLSCSDTEGILAAQALLPVASDNCDSSPLDITKTEGNFFEHGCSQAGTYINFFVATDACGNESLPFTQVITIIDNEKPYWISQPGDLDTTLECSDLAGIQVAQGLMPEVADNCDDNLAPVIKTPGSFNPNPGICGQTGSYTNTFTVFDACGNAALTYTQTITISDTTAPVWDNPEGDLDRVVSCSDPFALSEALSLFPTATDNCDIDVSDIEEVSRDYEEGDCTGTGIYTNTWRVRDNCGNVSRLFTQLVTVIDDEAPEWETKAGFLDREIECSKPELLIDAQKLFPEGSDNCDKNLIVDKITGEFVPGECGKSGTYKNTFTVTDDCGNTSEEFIQIITIVDTEAPTFTVPADTVICRDEFDGYNADPSITGDVTDEEDNCDTGLQATFSDDLSSLGDEDEYGYIFRIWTLTDECGNTSVDYQVIHVEPFAKVELPDADTLCNNDITSIEILSPTIPQNEIIFSYTYIPDNSAEVDIRLSGVQENLPKNHIIQDSLTNKSNEVQRVLLVVTPVILDAEDDPLCPGKNDTTTIWINPTARIEVNLSPDNVLCDEDTVIFMPVSGNGNIIGDWVYDVEVINSSDLFAIEGELNGSSENNTGTFSQILRNTTDNQQWIDYLFTSKIINVSEDKAFCGEGQTDTVRIWLHPIPHLIAISEDTLYCDSSTVSIEILNINGIIVSGTSLFDVYVEYPEGAVSSSYGTEVVNNTYPATITDYLVNNTNTLQVVNYILVPKIKKANTGDTTIYCDRNGIIDTISIYLNPTPRISALLNTDTILCDNSYHEIHFTSANPEFVGDPAYIIQTETNGKPGDVSGLLHGGIYGEFPLDDLQGETLVNNSREFRIITYNIKPVFRNVNGHTPHCDRGIDTSIVIYLNPAPVFDDIRISDTAVCNEGPVNFEFFNTQSVIGEVKYDLANISQNVSGIKDNTDMPFSLDSFTDTLINSSEQIQEVLYFFTPVIHEEARGIYCRGESRRIMPVEVAPTLRNIPEISEFIGGNNIRCFNDSSGFIHLNTRGGYYRGDDPYTVSWNREGSILNTDTTSLIGLNYGSYTYRVRDIIGCETDSTILLRQPEAVFVADSTKDITCSGYQDGEIFIEVGGGVSGYDIAWTGPNLFSKNIHLANPDADSLINAPEGTYYVSVTDTNGCVINKGIDLFPGFRVSVGLIPGHYGDYNISCKGESDGSVIVLAGGSGAPADFDYNWTDSRGNPVSKDANNKDISNKPAGWYFITVTDTAGCFESEEIELREPELLEISRVDTNYTDNFDISCYGYANGDISIEVSGGHSYMPGSLKYNWFDTESGYLGSSMNIASLDTGTYRVEVIDSFGCRAAEQWNLIQPGRIDYSIIDSSNYNSFNIACNSDSTGFFDLDIGGSSGYFRYEWQTLNGFTPDSASPDLLNATAGDYTLFVEDTVYNCSESFDFTLIEPDTLLISPELSNFNGYNISCYSDSNAYIILNPLGGVSPYSFNWSTTDGYIQNFEAEDQADLSAGMYSVRITDENNCVSEWSIPVSQPDKLIPALEIHPVDCFGDSTGIADLSVSGGVEDYSYVWSNGDTGQDIRNQPLGIYTVTINDQNNCITYDTANISESPEMHISFEIPAQYKGSAISCFGASDGEIQSSVEGGAGGYSWFWENTEDTSRNISGIPSGMYYLQVTDSFSCTVIDSVLLEDPLPLTTEVFTYDPSCFGYADGEIVVIPRGGTVDGDYSIYWPETGLYGQNAEGLTAGDYSVQIRDLNDCRLDTSAVLMNPDSIWLDKYFTHPECPDIYNGAINIQVYGGTPPFEYNWENGNTGSTLDNLREGRYILELRDFNLCVFRDTTLLESINESCLQIPTTFTPNGDGINDIWEIVNIDLYPESVMEIFNRWGKLIYRASPYYGNEWDGNFNGRALPVDSYHFVLQPGRNRKPVTGNITIIK